MCFDGDTRDAEGFGAFPAVRALNRAGSLAGHEREHDREDERNRAPVRDARCGDHGGAGFIAHSPAGEPDDDTMLMDPPPGTLVVRAQ